MVDINKISFDLKASMSELYGENFDKLILYGSYARGDFNEDSDIDFLLLLKNKEVKFGNEIIKIGKYRSNLGLKHGTKLSIFPISSYKFNSTEKLFYQNIKREGIEL
ncbi:Nucleotidyltransferase domain-containing protein [Pseudarcicella hirudinis]|uniref:Nucleotidyltransferase domain-containing protein n=1 Tax=Pseudarcicella hirudinis TaxID=1079859 RepID=A0A1I5RY18_9BACT|nr:nucleotidyltransferase domain-containing protein [Pseudarcicella hirudinis]SFP63363.1 Nucleotidyltransferase domain-containing protein [Pseudarcicella hirudinis]